MTDEIKKDLLEEYDKFIFTFRHTEFVIDGYADQIRQIVVESMQQPEQTAER